VAFSRAVVVILI